MESFSSIELSSITKPHNEVRFCKRDKQTGCYFNSTPAPEDIRPRASPVRVGLFGHALGLGRGGVFAQDYLSSTFPPAASISFFSFSASSFFIPSFSIFGAPSTRSLASFRPKARASFTILMTAIF